MIIITNLLRNKVGQTIMEFALIMTFVVIVLFAMQPLIKRNIQAMIKVTADQIGIQEKSEQLSYTSAEDGFFLGSNMTSFVETDTRTRDVNGEIIYTYNDQISANAVSKMYLGDSQK